MLEASALGARGWLAHAPVVQEEPALEEQPTPDLAFQPGAFMMNAMREQSQAMLEIARAGQQHPRRSPDALDVLGGGEGDVASKRARGREHAVDEGV